MSSTTSGSSVDTRADGLVGVGGLTRQRARPRRDRLVRGRAGPEQHGRAAAADRTHQRPTASTWATASAAPRTAPCCGPRPRPGGLPGGPSGRAPRSSCRGGLQYVAWSTSAEKLSWSGSSLLRQPERHQVGCRRSSVGLEDHGGDVDAGALHRARVTNVDDEREGQHNSIATTNIAAGPCCSKASRPSEATGLGGVGEGLVGDLRGSWRAGSAPGPRRRSSG